MLKTILGWQVLGVVVALLVGAGFAVLSMNPPRNRIAEVCYSIAAFIVLARFGWWAVTSGSPGLERLVVSFLVFGFIGSLWVAGLTWVESIIAPVVISRPISQQSTTQPGSPQDRAREGLLKNDPASRETNGRIGTMPQTNRGDPQPQGRGTQVVLAGTLKPAGEPNPPTFLTKDQVVEALKQANKHQPKEVIDFITRDVSACDPVTNVPDGVLKVYLGSNIFYTTKALQVILRIAGEDLLTIHRGPDGISLDAKMFSKDGRIVAEIKDNVFHVNPNNYFYVERPNESSLVVHGQEGETVLNVRYLNKLSVVVQGIFRYSNRAPVTITGKTIEGYVVQSVCSVFGDSAGALLNL